MTSKYIEGLKSRCLSDVPQESNSEWLNGFDACIEKLAYLEQALTYIIHEIFAVREFCENSETIEYTGKNGNDVRSERFRSDIPRAFARMAFNTAILAATKLYEISISEKHSKHMRALMQALDINAVNAIDTRIALLEIDKLKYLRDKIVAHIDPVSYKEIDSAVQKACPGGDLLAFLDLLEPRKHEPLMTTHEAIDKILVAIRAVPGYQSAMITNSSINAQPGLILG